jgi:biotin carboxyl carrier protein
MKYYATINDQEYEIEIDQDREIKVNGRKYETDFQQLVEGGVSSLLLDNRSLEAMVEERDDSWEVFIHGELYSVRVQDERSYRLGQAWGKGFEITGEVTLRSPMPGVIVAVPAAPGQHVAKGEAVVILESMKMENEMRSPRAGIVRQVLVAKGDTVEKGQVLAVVGDAPAE